ncbi:hypothetical protein VaNZ11_001921 [Volvox africanus]|uniref:Rab3-GAP regulatory subunit N-terminal domain-containing protein n=1 Tax=Volvox africanus TaxID=51714 RepID=A0ABQ5RS55_9CHLO|nr:hypothetical protein VaNZ11_001921 [Volvox africanus]
MHMALTTYQTYHAGEVYLALRRDFNWELLTPHARDTMLKCMHEEQPPKDKVVPLSRNCVDTTNDILRFYSWLYRVACDASPAKVAANNGLTCDRAFSGGRLLSYRYRMLIIVGGNQASTNVPKPPLLPPPLPLQQQQQQLKSRGKRGWEEMETSYHGGGGGDDDCFCNVLPRRGPGGGGGPSGIGRGPGGAGCSGDPATRRDELPNESRLHEATELRPLVSPVRLLLGAGAALWDVFPGPSRRLCITSPTSSASLSPPANCTLPPLEGCAVAVYGSCILVHGGISPAGEATGELRAFRLRPDLCRTGGYEMVGRVRVQQHGEGGGGAGGGAGGLPLMVAASRPQSASWLPALTVNATAAVEAVTDTLASAGDGGASRPCPPPSARHSHHMAVDSATSRLWMFGGCRGEMMSIASGGGGSSTSDWRRHDATCQQSLPAPFVRTSAEASERRADLVPCCFWAQLPAPRDAMPASSGMSTAVAAAVTTNDDGKVGGGGAAVTDRECADDDFFLGGDVVVSKVEWHCLPLRSSRRGGGVSYGNGARGTTLGPDSPDPTRVAAIAVQDGGLFVLSSGPGPAGGATAAEAAKIRSSAAPGHSEIRWWLHRIDLQTGLCELLGAPTASPVAASGGVNVAAAAAAAPPSQPPLYHDDAVAMADDILPYIYVYGSRQLCSGPAALSGGVFVPSLHRVSLDGGSGGGGGSGALGAAAGDWEAVELSGTARLHVARKALGTASGGTVILVSGVRDVRKGVEAQVQAVVPVSLKGGSAVVSCTANKALLASQGPQNSDRHVFIATALARCRRLIAERLRRAAPGVVRFTNPNAAVRDDGCRTGGGGGGGGVSRNSSSPSSSSRPCVALAAALSLYSRGGLFDEAFFEELDGDDGGGGCGMTMPGHDPLAVAAVVAWVMGRTHVRLDWEPHFLLHVFRVAHCWELAALQREIVALVSRLAPLLPLQHIPAALGLWVEMRRLGAVGMMASSSLFSSSSSLAAPAAGSGVRVEAELRSRLIKLASNCSLRPDNLEEVMEAVMAAEAENEAEEDTAAATAATAAAGREVTSRSNSSPFASLKQACLKMAEELLTPGSGGSGSSSCIGAPQVKGARAATRFACRFQIRLLLFQAMRWWRRRLFTCPQDAATLDHLLGLLSELKDMEKEGDAAATMRGPRVAPAAAGSQQDVFAPRGALNRLRVPPAPTVADSENNPLEPPPAAAPASSAPAPAPALPAAAASFGRCKAGVAAVIGATVVAEAEADARQKAVEADEEIEEDEEGGEDAVPLSCQLRGCLWGELFRCLRPHTALAVLEALDRGRCGSEATTAACEIWLYARQKAYDMLAVLSPMPRLQLPTKLWTGGARAATTHTAVVCSGTTTSGASGSGGGVGSGGKGNGNHVHTMTTSWGRGRGGPTWDGNGASAPPPPPPPHVTSLLRKAQPLSRACDAWQRAQEEEVLRRGGRGPG